MLSSEPNFQSVLLAVLPVLRTKENMMVLKVIRPSGDETLFFCLDD
ncbi:MAG: hypothetical protein SO117_00425 [Frisingicoccus sp.]|nr:hypothetical protein [Frisingicoccus sp.]